MKNLIFIIIFLILFVSCKKDNNNISHKYIRVYSKNIDSVINGYDSRCVVFYFELSQKIDTDIYTNISYTYYYQNEQVSFIIPKDTISYSSVVSSGLSSQNFINYQPVILSTSVNDLISIQ